jgi:chemotaxis signal transduction protein
MSKAASIDWAGVRALLEARLAALEQGPGPETIRAMLRLRAERLRRRPPDPEGTADARSYLIFSVGGRRYGIDLETVVEIVARPPCAPVPGAPERVAGVIQLRGEIRPVFNLARILGLPDPDPGERYVVLLVRNGTRVAGLRAGWTESIRAFRAGEIQPVEDPRAAGRTSDLITILDLKEILREEG